ncbi:hypothetical protein BH10ACT11_BH10ACT11_13750 [soil metagenome]
MKLIVRALAATASAAAALTLLAGIASGSHPASIRMNDHGPSGGKFAPDRGQATLRASGVEASWSYAAYTNAQHDVVEDKGLFKSPGKSGIDSTYRVQLSAGSYPYYCSFHGLPGRGMHGVVGVAPIVKRLTGTKSRVTWATADSASGDRFAVEWRIKGSKKWRHWKKKTKSFEATFGAGGSPVHVNASKRYEIRVRSLDHTKASRRSDFSPAVRLGG